MRFPFQSHFTDGNGMAVQSGTVTVYLTGTGTLATIYPDNTSSAISGSQVTTSSADGSFKFFVSLSDYDIDQRFRIVLSHQDFTTKTYDDVVIFPDNNDDFVIPDWWTTNTTPGTTDMTTAVQAALDTGKTVKLLGTTYAISSRLNITTEYQKIEGYGKGWASVLSFDNCTGMLINANNVTLRDFKMILADQGKDYHGIVNSDGGTTRYNQQWYDNIWLVGWDSAIYGIGTSASRFTNNRIQNCDTGFNFLKLCATVEISSNSITCDSFCILFQTSGSDHPEGITITNNLIYGATFGIYATTATHMIVSNNIIDHISAAAIKVLNVTYPTGGWNITDNWIGVEEGTTYGIWFVPAVASTLPNQITGNYIKVYDTDEDGTAEGKYGIYIDSNMNNNTIMGNATDGFLTYDIAVFSENNIIAGNSVFNTEALASGANISVQGNWNTWYGNNVLSTGVTTAGAQKFQMHNIFFTTGTAAPASGFWARGTVVFRTDPSSGASPGWVCTESGTFGGATEGSCSTANGSATITGMANSGQFTIGSYVDVSAGFASTGPFQVLARATGQITVDTNANATVSGTVTVDTSDPVFTAMANLA